MHLTSSLLLVLSQCLPRSLFLLSLITLLPMHLTFLIYQVLPSLSLCSSLSKQAQPNHLFYIFAQATPPLSPLKLFLPELLEAPSLYCKTQALPEPCPTQRSDPAPSSPLLLPLNFPSHCTHQPFLFLLSPVPPSKPSSAIHPHSLLLLKRHHFSPSYRKTFLFRGACAKGELGL